MKANTKDNKFKVSQLIKKYNEILVNSVSITLVEDLINLIVVNGDDKNFEIQDLVNDRDEFRQFVTKEFFHLNSSSVLNELKIMDDDFGISMIKKKNAKSKQRRLDF